ncbi:MAG: type I phosphomannose isomerase catalytic subunit [Verrucomicrobiota bacterium]|nr:type I phosphomannose isomerase catalytic subunit [Verrucomicrobiota bacterium]
MSIFKFEPIYKKRVWGGNQFSDLFDPKIDKKERFGESWNIVDRDDDQSLCQLSTGDKISLRELLEKQGQEVIGPNWKKGMKFPILIKWLDCQERLSLQVHPPATLCEKLGGEPKTENWYVVKSNESSGLFLGFNQETSKDELRKSLQNSDAEKLCHWIKSSPNDSVLVESGRIHAIDAGNLILEIQQNSDTTYRVFDWGRVGLDGQPRDLHIEESLESITFNDVRPSSIRTNNKYGIETIAKCEHFRIRRLNLSNKSIYKIKDSEYGCTILSPFLGKSFCENQLLEPGISYISPYSSSCKIETDEECCILITDCF